MESEKFYHIYNHANGNEDLFRSPENYRYFLQRYHHFVSGVVDTFAYCLMPNHIHFLIRIKDEATITDFIQTSKVYKNRPFDQPNETSKVYKNLGGLSEVEKRVTQQFSNLFNAYTKAFNRMYSRRGSLFTPNFKKKEIANETYFTKVIHYIHVNPIHHGFTKSIEEWPWSSFQSILSKLPTQLKRKDVLTWFGNSTEYIQYHNQPIDKKVMSILAD